MKAFMIITIMVLIVFALYLSHEWGYDKGYHDGYEDGEYEGSNIRIKDMGKSIYRTLSQVLKQMEENV